MANGPSPRADLVHKAICAGTLGHIRWKDSAVRLMLDDPEMEGFTEFGVRMQLRQFVLDGNHLDARDERGRRQERAEEHPEHPFWYRAVIPVPQFPRGLFVEVILPEVDDVDP